MPYNVFVHDLFLKLRSIVWISIEKLVYELKHKWQYEWNDIYSDITFESDIIVKLTITV